ncbi:DUF421 domain-containing protein [Pedobacter sp. N36a]|uniref:DUF421 domain-containing protein n=1 Tax=Pedobacter sp. N36a TaxID=2767996 RepID=UPI001656EE61|nr:YetF domain-containing protein [Pedobacter sp. N36a]MBC8985041.1 DUF421 domain-containing protein [Pedobacter sp. N36a]
MLLNIDWTKFLIGEADWEFMVEICLRTFIMYFIILIGLRLLGKRGVKQLSVFELVVIISLGSAAGDPMFYKEIGLLVPVLIFAVIVSAYRMTTFLMARSKKMDDLIEGTCVYLIKDGEFSIKDFGKEGLAYDEFFSEMRQQSISHLGQVESVILETSGNLSIYYFSDEKVKYGLPILPELFDDCHKVIPTPGIYACAFCGNVEELNQSLKHSCIKCQHESWIKAINPLRIK